MQENKVNEQKIDDEHLTEEYLETLSPKEIKDLMGKGIYKGESYKLLQRILREKTYIRCDVCDRTGMKWYQPMVDDSGRTKYFCKDCWEKENLKKEPCEICGDIGVLHTALFPIEGKDSKKLTPTYKKEKKKMCDKCHEKMWDYIWNTYIDVKK